MIKLVVYDCDGVLVDSGGVILTYYNWVMEKCGLPKIDWTQGALRTQIMSMADRDMLEILSGGDPALFQKMLDIAKNEPNDIGFDSMVMETDLIKGLDYVREKGLPMAVLTNRGRSLPHLLRYFKIEDYFRMLVTARDVTHPKPSPEGLMKICSAFEVNPSEIIYIGDSPTDYEAARACGAPFLAYKKKLGDAPVIYGHTEIEKYL